VKRATLILITAVYLLSCVGIGVNRFYCCGKLASVTLIYGVENSTPRQAGKANNCCKNEKVCFKVKDSHYNTISFSLDNPVPALVPNCIYLDKATIAPFIANKISYKGKAPPGYSDIPAYTLNCTYRI
jgi:hypothetical protein